MYASQSENSTRFQSIFQPGRIGKLYIKNRLIMAAMGNALADDQGRVTAPMLAYYAARARGGAGMVITQFASISKDDVMPYNLRLDDDSYVEGIRSLVDVIHEGGARACIQLMHPGMLLLLLKSVPQGATIKTPSVTNRMGKDKPFSELSVSDIERYIDDFAAAAARVKEAGADAVEVHACHGCLLSTFLTPAVNNRQDEYGGSVENRSRFPRLVVERIRARLGPDFPLLVRINGRDDVPGGVAPEEVVRQAALFKSSGADAVSISSGLEYWSTLMAPSYLTPPGIVIPAASAVKKELNLPVIVSGKIDPDLAEKTVGGGQADFVALGRPLLADPELPVKLLEGRTDEIARCLYCNNCLKSSWRSCTVNPFLYRETASPISPSPTPKKVMVIGGGPAGLESALLCKLGGHQVSLFEKEAALGGQWRTACGLPGKEGYASFIDYLKNRLEKLGVPVTLNKEITREDVAELSPQVVIVAAGAVPSVPDLAGSGGRVVPANDVILGKAAVEGSAAVIGASLTAMETALWLAEQGKPVALVSHSALGGRKGPDDMITFRGLLRRLVQLRVPLYLNAEVLELNGNSLVVRWGGEMLEVPADTVIAAVGVQPLDKLVGELKGIVPEVYAVGDCQMPGNAAQATFSASRLAAKL